MKKTPHVGVLGYDGSAEFGTPTGLVEVWMSRHSGNNDNDGNNDYKNSDNDNKEIFP